jgi:hypothetical protein
MGSVLVFAGCVQENISSTQPKTSPSISIASPFCNLVTIEDGFSF